MYRVHTVVWDSHGNEPNPDTKLEDLLNKEEEKGYVLAQLYALAVPSKKTPTVVVITTKSLTTMTNELFNQAAEQVKSASADVADFVTRHAAGVKEAVKKAVGKVQDGDKGEDATV